MYFLTGKKCNLIQHIHMTISTSTYKYLHLMAIHCREPTADHSPIHYTSTYKYLHLMTIHCREPTADHSPIHYTHHL